MRILITGGAGFIGSNFVKHALSQGSTSSITVLDSLTYAGNIANLDSEIESGSIEFVKGDIRDSKLVAKLMGSVDAVIHFAAESHVDRSIASASEFISTNVGGTQVLLDAAISSNIKKFIHISTDEVYGSIQSGSWNESCPLEPNSPYAASKAASDLVVRSYNRTHRIPTIITRCSNNYGPFQNVEKAIPKFVTNLIIGKQIPLYGQGLQIRDWLHVSDHCNGIYLALEKGIPGEIYNFGGGRELSNKQLVGVLLDQLGSNWDSVKYVEDRLAHDFRYSVNFSKAQKDLGYLPKVDFETGIAKTIEWYRSNQLWWS
jgi:dTDP-glucose 4,6-dehydratase